MSRRGLAIIAKPPAPGLTKTRLTPPLTGEQAASLSGAFLRDVMLAAFAVEGIDIRLVVPPGSPTDIIADLAPRPITFLEERGSDLGEVQQHAMTELVDAGCDSVVVIGGDLPTLSSGTLDDAFECLDAGDCDVVLGPAMDGGYYLFGARQAVPDLFEAVEWSTPRVLDQTLERASDAGLSVKQLPALSDIDTYEDLERLVADLAQRSDLAAPATRRILRELRAAGAQIPAPAPPWGLLGQRTVLETPWRSLLVDRVRTHSGDELDWHYVSAPEPVVVVPVTADGDIVLIRQYRQPLRDWSLEVPAGTGTGTFDEVARMELREEIGASQIGQLRYVGSWHPMTGHASTLAHVYLAFDVQPGQAQLERNELLTSYVVPAELAFDMARRGEITDGTCALAILVCEPEIRTQLDRRGER